MNENDVDADFNAGFADAPDELTTTPDTNTDATASTTDESQANDDQQSQAQEPEYAKITKADFDALMAKAKELDDVKTENKSQFDKAFGKLGGIQQVVERLQANTQAGKSLSVSEDDFKELKDEGYSDLAQMTAAGFNRILEKANLKGTGESASGINEDKVKEIFSSGINPLKETLHKSLKDEIREEMAKETLTDMHDDWVNVINSKEFGAWRDSNKIGEKKDSAGKLFAESLNPNFVGKIISDFKATQKQAAARQNRISAAVAPKGVGGHATGQSNTEDDDEFNAGFYGSKQ